MVKDSPFPLFMSVMLSYTIIKIKFMSNVIAKQKENI